ncbi:MAG: zinc-dependent metalloprotease [Bacteroidota bacterium]
MKELSLLSLLFLVPHLFFAQERIYRQYATQRVHQRLLAENPDMADRLKQMENHIAQFGDNPGSDSIAVIFHVLQGPNSLPIKEEEIYDQLDMLNRDFGPYEARKKEYKMDAVQALADRGVDMGIYFCLADQDAQPVRYIQTETDEWSMDDAIKKAEKGGAAPHRPDRYLNIWVAELGEGISGYAQMPGGPVHTDGIVIDQSFFARGLPSYEKYYGKGVTLTHLVGNYLGLYDLWNEETPCADDKVADTPIHNSPNASPGALNYHMSTCPGSPVEMSMNFMDNTDDGALTMFTPGQKRRVKANLSAGGFRFSVADGTATRCGKDGLEEMIDRSAMMGGNDTNSPDNNTLSIFPNPAKDEVFIAIQSTDEGLGKLSVFNSQGILLLRRNEQLNKGNFQMNIDCRNWPPGVYYIKVLFQDGSSLSENLTIDR